MTMKESKTGGALYIDTFKNEIIRLCDPYTHPVYLSLLGDFEKRLLKDLKKALNTAINHLPASNNERNLSELIHCIKKELTDKITSILGEEQEGLSKDAIQSKQLSIEELQH